MDPQDGARVAELTILVDNVAPDGLEAEHGFSLWLEVSGRHLLFDTGQSAMLGRNAGRLGIDLSQADALVLSHGHYDHTGGVAVALDRASDAEIYLHPAALGSHYSIRGGVVRDIAMPRGSRDALERATKETHWVTEPVSLGADVWLSGPIARLTAFEDPGGPFFLDGERSAPDPIADDLALWVCTERGLVVICGCCHSGLVNTLLQAEHVSGESRLLAVVGGLHLGEASDLRLEETVRELRARGAQLVVPCHCTGEVAALRLEDRLGSRVVRGGVGVSLRFGSGGAPCLWRRNGPDGENPGAEGLARSLGSST